jgi:hypothetical protein
MRYRVRGGAGRGGGIVGYPLDQLHEEVAYIAYHFHWPLEQILSLEHADRRRWVEEISKINQRLNGEEPEPPAVEWSLLRSQFPSFE